MWKVEVSVYNAVIKNFFNSRTEALKYCNTWKGIDATVIIEDMSPVDGYSYVNGEITVIQKASK